MQSESIETSAGIVFWKASSSDAYQPPDQRKGVAAPPVADVPDAKLPRVTLPDPQSLGGRQVDLVKLIGERRTLRAYSNAALSLDELGCLLWCTQGVAEYTEGERTLRTVPSAGARHAFETRLLVNNVTDLEPGLYQYCALTHELAGPGADRGTVEDVISGFRNINLIASSAVTFIWVADAYRMTWKFGERGYRYLLLDAGHICQNLYLAAEALGCGACAVGSFDDEELNSALGLDGVTRFVAYAGTVGRKEEGAA